jgi:hypothetical protein
VGEEIMFNYPGLGGTQEFQVRGDVTLFNTTNGGAVFATGSMVVPVSGVQDSAFRNIILKLHQELVVLFGLGCIGDLSDNLG